MRLIDADALKARIMMDVPGFLEGGSSITKAFILAILETRKATPTIDAVQVVRCKNCKKHGSMDCPLWTDAVEFETADDWFCADGKPKKE